MFRRTVGLLALAWVAGACTASVSVVPPPEGTVPQLEEASQLGRLLAHHDAAALRATDELVRQGVSPGGEPPFNGWITVPNASGILVRFIQPNESGAKAVYDVQIPASGTPQFTRLDPPQVLPEDQASAYRARQLALNHTPLECSKAYNPAVFRDPRGSDGSWLVYVLAASADSDVVMLGQHYRVGVSSDGKTILNSMALSKSCGTINFATAPEGARPLALAASNLATPTPNESHVFLSYQQGMPFVVRTSLGKWVVTKDSIRYLGPLENPES